jgi:NitT/TauT family transport system permease protein
MQKQSVQPNQPHQNPANKFALDGVINGAVTGTTNATVGKTQPSSRQRASLKPTVFWRIAEDIPAWLQWLLMITSISLPLVLWWYFSHLETANQVFLPKPEAVWAALQDLAQKGLLAQDFWASITRVSLGFFLAAIVSIPIGIGMGAFASIRALFEPAIGLLRYMPAPAFVPLLILYMGIDEGPKVMLIFIGTVFYNTLMVMDAVKFVPKSLIETTYTLGGNRPQTLMRVIMPYILPNIIDSLRINIAASWSLVIVAELIAAQVGLGKRISLAQRFLHTDQIFAYLLVLGIIGFVIDLSWRWLLRVTCRWTLES